MGNACIWYEPKGAGVVVKVDLGAPLADLQTTVLREERTSETLDGTLNRMRLRSRSRIVVESAPFTDYALMDSLEDVANSLNRGGRISLAEDDTAAWAAFCDPWAVADELSVERGMWSLYGGTFNELDRVTVTGPSPRYLQETTMVTNIPGGIPDIAAFGGTFDCRDRRNDWSDEGWIFARNSRFWPCLRQPVEELGSQLILHKHRRTFRLSMTLDEDLAGIAALSKTPGVTLQGTTDTGKPTMGDQIRANT